MMVFAMIPAGAGTLYADAADGVKYTITFQDEDGNVLQTSEVEEGVRPVYTGDHPEKAEDDTYVYLFQYWKDTKGWQSEEMVAHPEFPPATEGMTYTAIFSPYVKDPQNAVDVIISGRSETVEYDGEKHPMPFVFSYRYAATQEYDPPSASIITELKGKNGDNNLWYAESRST